MIQIDDLLKHDQNGTHQCLGVGLPARFFFYDARPHPNVGAPLGEFDDFDSTPPLGQDTRRLVGHPENPADAGLRSDGENLVLCRVHGVIISLGGDDEVLPILVCCLNGRQRAFPADEQRHDHLGKEDDIPQSKERALDDTIQVGRDRLIEEVVVQLRKQLRNIGELAVIKVIHGL